MKFKLYWKIFSNLIIQVMTLEIRTSRHDILRAQGAHDMVNLFILIIIIIIIVIIIIIIVIIIIIICSLWERDL